MIKAFSKYCSENINGCLITNEFWNYTKPSIDLLFVKIKEYSIHIDFLLSIKGISCILYEIIGNLAYLRIIYQIKQWIYSENLMESYFRKLWNFYVLNQLEKKYLFTIQNSSGLDIIL